MRSSKLNSSVQSTEIQLELLNMGRFRNILPFLGRIDTLLQYYAKLD